jgi:hypothetical protein
MRSLPAAVSGASSFVAFDTKSRQTTGDPAPGLMEVSAVPVPYQRCGGMDIRRKTIHVCTIMPEGKETRTFGTMTPSLADLVQWVQARSVQCVTYRRFLPMPATVARGSCCSQACGPLQYGLSQGNGLSMFVRRHWIGDSWVPSFGGIDGQNDCLFDVLWDR